MLSVFLLILGISSKAQKIDTIYFTYGGKKGNSTDYQYYRLAKRSKELFIVSDYFKNGQIKMKGIFKSIDPQIKHGDFVDYYPSGQISRKSYFENDSLIRFKSFTTEGELMPGNFYADAYMYGTYTENNLPQFPGGETELVKFVKNNLKYTEEMRKDGVSGSITVKFTISKTGEINNIKVKKSLSLNLDNEAIRILKLMPKWRPAVENGNIVSRKGTLIFNFNPNQKSD